MSLAHLIFGNRNTRLKTGKKSYAINLFAAEAWVGKGRGDPLSLPTQIADPQGKFFELRSEKRSILSFSAEKHHSSLKMPIFRHFAKENTPFAPFLTPLAKFLELTTFLFGQLGRPPSQKYGDSHSLSHPWLDFEF